MVVLIILYKDKFDVIRNIQENINSRKEEAKKQKIAENDIEGLDFSIRSFNCLKRAGINTINQLASLSEEEIMKIRNLGLRGAEEIISKLEAHGLKHGKLSKSPEVENETEEIINKNTFEIVGIDLSVRSYNCLRRAGIETLADLENLTYEELMNIRNLKQESIEEIISKVKKYGITFEGTERGTEEPATKKYSESEMEEIKTKKTELEAEFKALEEQTRKAKELLAEYNKLIGDDKVNTDDEVPDFKDE